MANYLQCKRRQRVPIEGLCRKPRWLDIDPQWMRLMHDLRGVHHPRSLEGS